MTHALVFCVLLLFFMKDPILQRRTLIIETNLFQQRKLTDTPSLTTNSEVIFIIKLNKKIYNNYVDSISDFSYPSEENFIQVFKDRITVENAGPKFMSYTCRKYYIIDLFEEFLDKHYSMYMV